MSITYFESANYFFGISRKKELFSKMALVIFKYFFREEKKIKYQIKVVLKN